MTLSLISLATNFSLGASLGVAGGMLGIGGGLIAIPILGLLYGMNQHLAQGTALVMIAPNVLLGLLRYHQKNPVDFRSVAVISVFSMVTTYLAARLAVGIDADVLHVAFALFLIALALYFGWPKGKATHEESGKPIPRPLLPVIGVASGAMSGFFTIGGGLVVVPALALVVPGAFIALAAYGQAGQVDWETGLPMALGGVLSVSWGVHLAHQLPAPLLRWLFCAVLVGTAAVMLAT